MRAPLGPETTDVRLNGRRMSEGYLNAMLAADFGICVTVVCRTLTEVAGELEQADWEGATSATVSQLPEARYLCEVEFLGTRTAMMAAEAVYG